METLTAEIQPGTAQVSDARAFSCSVVVSLYNKGDYIGRALRSVLAQTVPPLEIIVVDDGSTDHGPSVVAELAASDNRIRIFRQPNAGVSTARNCGVSEARGTFVAFLDADDAYLPWLLEEFSVLAGRFPNADLLGAQFREVPANFALTDEARRAHSSEGVQRKQLASFYDRWWRGTPFFTSSSCARRSALFALGEPFAANERIGEDLDLFFRLAERAPVAWSSRVSSLYALGVAGSLTSSGAERDIVPAFARLKQRALGGTLQPHERRGALECLATYWMTVARRRIRGGDFSGAARLLGDPITRHRPVYWIRTAAMLAFAALRQRFIPRPAATLDRSVSS